MAGSCAASSARTSAELIPRDEDGRRTFGVISHVSRGGRACRRCKKQYFLKRPHKPAINFPRTTEEPSPGAFEALRTFLHLN